MGAPTLLDEMIGTVRADEDLVLAVSTTLPGDTNLARTSDGAIRLTAPRLAGDWLTGTVMCTSGGQWEPAVTVDSVLIHVAQIVTVTTHRRGERLAITVYDGD